MGPGVGTVGLRYEGSLPSHPTPRWVSCPQHLFLFPFLSLFTSTSTRIPPSPQLIPLSLLSSHPQDTLGGRFDATQAFVGELAHFAVWDHMLAPAEILALANCTSHLQGNVIQWDDQAVEVFGGASKAAFTACDEGRKA